MPGVACPPVRGKSQSLLDLGGLCKIKAVRKLIDAGVESLVHAGSDGGDSSMRGITHGLLDLGRLCQVEAFRELIVQIKAFVVEAFIKLIMEVETFVQLIVEAAGDWLSTSWLGFRNRSWVGRVSIRKKSLANHVG